MNIFEFIEITKNEVIIMLLINIIQLVQWIISTIINYIIVTRKISYYEYYLIIQKTKKYEKIIREEQIKNNGLLEFDYYYNKIGKIGITIFILSMVQITIFSLLSIGQVCVYGFITQCLFDFVIIILYILFKYNIHILNRNENIKYNGIKNRYKKYFDKQEMGKGNEKN